ncbi:NACHT domain protein [Aspergillus parasiticus SU-1]|uniref:NACHT domain protein n=1 Tax=Aspergillus parasiticus (strain ATCC 56775 / NRRL 5862 / SRRC 143 / SU-1) TaxID=1403190 RepID=A0A0F0IBT8_ASPPU|nr:NACHT domain protein [Aspergillus parasiticus SU-1]
MRLASAPIDASLMQDALIYHPGASAELKSLPITLVRVNHQHNSCLLSIKLKMLGKLRKKLRYFRKGERSDDTGENFHPANLSQKGKDEVVFESGKSRIEAAKNAKVDQPVNDTKHLNEKPTEENLKTRNPDQQNDAKCLEEAKHDGVDADVSPISKPHTKGTGLEEDRELVDPESGPRALDELKKYHKQDEAETPECPVSKTTPADEKAVERSDKPSNADLWQRAFDELNGDLKGRLRQDEAMSPENAIKEVIDRTKESFEAYQNGGLKFKKYDGKEVNVRDVAKKILNSAIHCSDIIKGIAAFDPSNHASSAWGIVSLGLTMAKNSVDQKEAAFKSSEFLSDILARYVILNGHRRKEKLPSSDGLDDAIVQVYKAILEYTAEVKKRLNASRLNRMGNSIFPVSDTELNHLQSAVKDQDKKVSDWSQINNYIYQSTKADEILASIEKVYQNTETIKVKVNAGSGKSILCSTIIQDIEKDCSNDLSSIFSYWYFQFSRDETQNVKNMTRSIIRQLVPEELPGSLVSLWKEHGRQNREPDQDKLSTVLRDVINNYTGDRLFLIFDALDECPDNEVHERDLLFQVLKGLIDEHGKKIHLLATSRYEENIRCHLEESLKIDLEYRMNDDVEAFVRDALDHGKLSRWKKEKGVNDQILAKLLDTKEPRRFRWADLQIKRLEKCKKRDQITESLETIPKTLEETYQRILQDIPEDEKEDARSILTWLSFSLEPLRLETVAAVVGFPHPEDVVETCTTYLVTVSPSNGTLKLAHFSVKEFLVVSDPIHWYHLTTIGGHMDIANRALDDMLDKTEVLTEKPVHDLPLLNYVVKYWRGHFSELTVSSAGFSDLEKKVYRLFEERIAYLNWRRVARDNFRLSSWDIGYDAVEPPIYLACEMGMQGVVERLLSLGAHPCAEFDDGYSGIQDTFIAAARNGHLTIVQQLLGNIEISAKIACDIASYIHLDKVPHEEVEGLLNSLLSTKILCDKTANGCVLLNEDFVKAIALNGVSGHRLMCHLLDRQDKLEVPVTESVLYTALCNSDGGETMRVLLDRRRKDIQITELLMQKLPGLSLDSPGISDLILQILRHWGATVPLNQAIIVQFVRYASVNVMELLLQIRGHEIQDTEELLAEVAAANKGRAFRLLWERVSGIEITSKTWQRIVWMYDGVECMEMVLAKCHQGYFLESEIMQRAAKSYWGLPLMRMLLDKREAGLVVFDVSEATMIAAASNPNYPPQMMELVINNADSEILINEKILCSAIRNRYEGESALEYLLELDQHLPITEEVLVVAASYFAIRLLELLFNKFPDVPVTDRVFKAARNRPEVLLSAWLKRGRHGQDCQLIGRLLEQGIMSLQGLTKLFDEGLVDIDDNLVDAVGAQKALIMALHGCDAMEKLLNLRRDDITVTEEVVLRVLDQVCVDGQAFKMLMDRLGSAVPITEKILEKAFLKDQPILLDFLLKEGRNWNLQKVWDTIWQNHGYLLRDIVRCSNALLNYGEFDVSQTLLEFLPLHAKGGFSVEDLDGLVNLCAGRDISARAMEMLSMISFRWGNAKTIRVFIDRLGSAVPMTKQVWYALWRNDEFSFKQKVIISNILLQYGEFDVSQILLKFLPLKEENEGFSDEEIDELVNLCVGQDISAPATEMLIEILFERGNANSIMKFVKRKPTIQLTDSLIQRAERNERAYKKVLMPFLYSKRAADQNIKVAEAKTEAEED